jgi:hypothetical protein
MKEWVTVLRAVSTANNLSLVRSFVSTAKAQIHRINLGFLVAQLDVFIRAEKI